MAKKLPLLVREGSWKLTPTVASSNAGDCMPGDAPRRLAATLGLTGPAGAAGSGNDAAELLRKTALMLALVRGARLASFRT